MLLPGSSRDGDHQAPVLIFLVAVLDAIAIFDTDAFGPVGVAFVDSCEAASEVDDTLAEGVRISSSTGSY
ncbi:hypothetical protein C9J85_02890 [Haloferax sp. wsp5]|nr:hypothetical protein C9J85_02890 [Haloferax sp. wsp5]